MDYIITFHSINLNNVVPFFAMAENYLASVATMEERPGKPGRPRSLPAKLRPNIAGWIKEGKKQHEILRLLWDEFEVRCSRGTLTRRIRQWGLATRVRSEVTPQLCERVRTLFGQKVREPDLLRVLREEGFEITALKLREVRLGMGLRRRYDAPREKPAGAPRNGFTESTLVLKEAVGEGAGEAAGRAG